MSWSISVIGSPEGIIAELERQSEKLDGQSKFEFDEARPLIAGLLQQNFAREAGYQNPLIRLEASGSGSARDDAFTKQRMQLQRSCKVSIEPIWAKIVLS